MKQNKLTGRVDHLLEQGRKTLQTERFVDMRGDMVDAGLYMGFRTASLSFIRMLYGEQHIYYLDFNLKTATNKSTSLKVGINILTSIRDEIENGWLDSIKRLVSAEIFSSFLEMSEYLLEEGYKDASAVMIGSVLEEQLRVLCDANSIPVTFNRNGNEIPKKSNLLNADLYKAEIYNRLDNKSITAWLDLRNSAAHGKYNEYSYEDVKFMYEGVINFISKN